MFQLAIPLVMAIVGGALYVFASNPKLAEIGKLLCAAGLFATAFNLAGKTFAL
jgi:hypothetical protein